MTITQTIEVPDSRRITLDLPPEIPTGKVVLTFSPAVEEDGSCPLCAKYRDPETGNPRYNAQTVAAIEEGMAISRGEIPARRFNSLAEMLEDLEKEDPDD